MSNGIAALTTARFEVDDGVGRLILNRPERLNAMTSKVYPSPAAALEGLLFDGMTIIWIEYLSIFQCCPNSAITLHHSITCTNRIHSWIENS